MLINMAAMAISRSLRENVTLIGSSGAPAIGTFLGFPSSAFGNLYWAFAAIDNAPTSIVKADAQRAGFKDGDLASYTTVHAWVIPQEFTGTYWIRATLEATNTPNGGGSDAMDTWLTLDANVRFWGWHSSGSTPFAGTIKVEIADDTPQASNIVATGYYRGIVTMED